MSLILFNRSLRLSLMLLIHFSKTIFFTILLGSMLANVCTPHHGMSCASISTRTTSSSSRANHLHCSRHLQSGLNFLWTNPTQLLNTHRSLNSPNLSYSVCIESNFLLFHKLASSSASVHFVRYLPDTRNAKNRYFRAKRGVRDRLVLISTHKFQWSK